MLFYKKTDSVINITVEFDEGVGKVSLKNIAEKAKAYKSKKWVTYFNKYERTFLIHSVGNLKN